MADLRVTRVGTPSVIKEVAFNPAVNKDNGVAAPSSLQKGDIIYAKLTINSIELGDRTTNGAWLGVPVEVPVNYIPGEVDNNLVISVAIRDAVAAAIEANDDINSGTYIRELGSGDPSCDECAYIYLAGRVFNSPIEVIESTSIIGSQFILASSAYTIGNITESEKSVYDWIQCVRTAFEDPKLSQGYMTAPAAFAEFNQADRVNLGQSMEEVCSDPFHKWLALIDCGPYYVTSIKDYKDFVEHNPAAGFEEDDLALIENVIYRWTDANPLNFTSANYDELSPQRSANPAMADGSRRSLEDNRFLYVQTAADTATNALTLTSEWPSALASGELMEVALSQLTPSPTAPTYTDLFTSAQNADLVGSFFVIASDVDSSLNANQIKLATSRTRALANESVDIVTGGSPQGGGLLDLQTTNAAWGFDVTIKGKTSNVIEVNNSAGASVNTRHLPGSLQKPTEKQDFKAYVRQLTNPASAIGIGGNTLNYFNAASISVANTSITMAAHGLNTRDKVYVQQLPSATRFGLTAFGSLTSVNFAAPIQTSADYPDGVYTNVEVTGGSGEGAFADITLLAGAVTAFTVTAPGINYVIGDNVTIAQTSIGGGAQDLILAVDGIAATPALPTFYVIKVSDNEIQLASSEANAEAGTALAPLDQGVDSASVKTPIGAPAQGIITTGGNAIVFSSEHGLKTAERVYFDGDIGTLNTTLFKGTTSTASTLYYVKVLDKNFFELTPSASNLAAEVFLNFPTEDITTVTPVRIYRRLASTLSGGTFSDSGLVRFIRGRKYQMDATLAVFAVKDEAGVSITTGVNDPYGVAYADDLSTDIRLSVSTTPEAVAEHAFNAAAVTNATDSITVTAHGYVTGQSLRFSVSTGATLADGLEEDEIYYAIIVDANTLQFAETAADAVAGNAVVLADDGVDNSAGQQGIITLDSSPYTFTYTEDEESYPLNQARDFAGENNFYCVPLSTGDQANSSMGRVYLHVALEDSVNITSLYSSYGEIEFVEPQAIVPNSYWNFNAVTSGDLIAEALRGVNNNGTAQAEVVETGMDSHNRLFSESQKYSTTQGFLAYYAPYVLNDVGVYIPPTPFVAGLAMRRYRDEIAGFRLPPAGAKYSLAGARGVQVEITTGMQDVSNPYGLNALRQLPGYSETDPDTGDTYGPVFAWGARTRINPANAEQALYKFVNTRVIMNVIFGTLDGALDGQIFNIIDGRAVTFNQIRTLISNILYSQFYVPGCLFGSTAAAAFDVVVDDRNNPSANLENGLVNVQVFVVPVPTLERIEIDLLRVNIGGISDAKTQLNLN